jgi:hypothetical protein
VYEESKIKLIFLYIQRTLPKKKPFRLQGIKSFLVINNNGIEEIISDIFARIL